MSLGHSPSIVTNGLVMYYDMSNTKKSWMGAPAINRIVTVPLTLGTYAYASGPVAATVIDASFQPRTVNRYTVTSTINTARAAIFPTGLSLAIPYAFSCIWKYNGTNTTSPSFTINPSKGNPEVSGNNSFSSYTQTNTALGNGWVYSKHEFTLSVSVTLASILTFGIDTGADATYLNNTFDVYNIQFEQNTYATPYVEGTRSTTQAVIDLTNNNTLTATSLTYAADGTFSFNGTNNIVSAASAVPFTLPTGVTFSAWFKHTNAGQSVSFIGGFGNTGAYGYWLGKSGSTLTWSTGNGTANARALATMPLVSTTHNAVGTYDGASTKLYLDGVLIETQINVTGSINFSGLTDLPAIGNIQGMDVSRYWTGSVYSASVYNRALTATEIDQNFQATRDRYGI